MKQPEMAGEPLPPRMSLQHPLLRKFNIILIVKEKCLKEFYSIYVHKHVLKGEFGA